MLKTSVRYSYWLKARWENTGRNWCCFDPPCLLSLIITTLVLRASIWNINLSGECKDLIYNNIIVSVSSRDFSSLSTPVISPSKLELSCHFSLQRAEERQDQDQLQHICDVIKSVTRHYCVPSCPLHCPECPGNYLEYSCLRLREG